MDASPVFDSTHAPDFGRRETLEPALRRLADIAGATPVLIETGTLRNESPRGRHGDGWSSLAWAWFAAQTGGMFHTVDIDPDCLDACCRVTAEYADCVQYHHADSLEFLHDYAGKVAKGEEPKVSLFYLDSMDYLDECQMANGELQMPEGSAEGQTASDRSQTSEGMSGKERSEEHHLAEAKLACLSAADSCLILFDDTALSEGMSNVQFPITNEPELAGIGLTGKGARAIPWLVRNGWQLEWCREGQALLSRVNEPRSHGEHGEDCKEEPDKQTTDFADFADFKTPKKEGPDNPHSEFRIPHSRQSATSAVGSEVQSAESASLEMDVSASSASLRLNQLPEVPKRKGGRSTTKPSGAEQSQSAKSEQSVAGSEVQHAEPASSDADFSVSSVAPWLNPVPQDTHQSAIPDRNNLNSPISNLHSPIPQFQLTTPPTGSQSWRYLTPELWREERWQGIKSSPLRHAGQLFEAQTSLPYLRDYLATILCLAPPGARTLEVGGEHGFGAAWLWHRRLEAAFTDGDRRVVERGRALQGVLGSAAQAVHSDSFRFYEPDAPRVQVLHHQGMLQQYPVPWMRALLAQQVCRAEYVVFSVPSVYYPFEASGRERLLPLEEWRRILSPFKVKTLRYYGDPRLGGREHVLCVLEGQRPTGALRHLMQVPARPFPDGISAIVHTRNEERQIAACLETLYGWADEIILADMESTDRTLQMAAPFTRNLFHHPRIDLLDQSRNAAACRARYSWVCVLDADERWPAALRPLMRRLLLEQGESFAAIQIPFLHTFAGKWLTSLWPGYKAPTLCRNGCFYFHPRPHAGPRVEGAIMQFRPEPELLQAQSIEHFSFPSVENWVNKMNRYTGVEAAGMLADGERFDWRRAVMAMVDDMHMYFDAMGGKNDGVHGLIYALAGGIYRLMQHAKLYEARYHDGSLIPEEERMPASMEEVLAFALARVRALS